MENATELRLGQILTFDYPAANYRGISPRYERRTLLVEELRDCGCQPLSPVTYQLDPLLNRGRTLVRGVDLDKCEKRCFYVESMRDLDIVGPQSVMCILGDRNANDYTVAWMTCDDDWHPSSGELPDEFLIIGTLIANVASTFAETIVARANLECDLLGRRGKWAIAVPPGIIPPKP